MIKGCLETSTRPTRLVDRYRLLLTLASSALLLLAQASCATRRAQAIARRPLALRDGAFCADRRNALNESVTDWFLPVCANTPTAADARRDNSPLVLHQTVLWRCHEAALGGNSLWSI
ncbi:hypothetical protein FOTG_13698 [Fusarium oxysporum f. sp. vasinfectum 25433]|uniref:Uncharacterized protein n=1 Tax=Fusarium oxysporum f. sp. vasinfectum 25433 TaxID=1089449 RepID=X0KWZ8_FUSOX|nr:hypothetical protein FOTG_13698 [Fusarium oxysporum f. sp. vasinfectum 25433]